MDKFILKSKTVLSAILMLIPVAGQWFGWNITADDSALISNFWDSIITVIGFAGVLYGRAKAVGGISMNPSE